ncbi:hypothetical protein CcCBS67573_g00026 [Chytriomyces confervae]|uniref:CRAL-TRIO domain-containing protein n=1 Tax=Chytriomyces confervae TaxID=246404 RepID=A0A507FT73_9FUNG|nr:hypothetical protein CcCBS67573_g00026 [Chytriomyces confervae]
MSKKKFNGMERSESTDELNNKIFSLRCAVDANEALAHLSLTDALLERALWARNCSVADAEAVLVAYCHWYLKTLGDAKARMGIHNVHAFLLTGILQIPGWQDADGQPVLLVLPNRYCPAKIPERHIVNALMYMLECLTTKDQRAKRHGITILCDMTGWGWENFSMGSASRILQVLSYSFPVRIRKIVLMNAPEIFTQIVWTMITPMMSLDLAERFVFHTYDTILELFEEDQLLAELGGTREHVAMETFVQARYRSEGLPFSPISLATVNWQEDMDDITRNNSINSLHRRKEAL